MTLNPRFFYSYSHSRLSIGRSLCPLKDVIANVMGTIQGVYFNVNGVRVSQALYANSSGKLQQVLGRVKGYDHHVNRHVNTVHCSGSVGYVVVFPCGLCRRTPIFQRCVKTIRVGKLRNYGLAGLLRLQSVECRFFQHSLQDRAVFYFFQYGHAANYGGWSFLRYFPLLVSMWSSLWAVPLVGYCALCFSYFVYAWFLWWP